MFGEGDGAAPVPVEVITAALLLLFFLRFVEEEESIAAAVDVDGFCCWD